MTNDVPFPAWVSRSPAFSMARVLGKQLRRQQFAASTETATELSTVSNCYNTLTNCGMSFMFHKSVDQKNKLFSFAEPTAASAVSDGRLGTAKSSQTFYMSNVLDHPHVSLLIVLSQVKEIISRQTGVTVKNAPALVSFMFLAIELRSFPSTHTKLFYSESTYLYAELMRCMDSKLFSPCVDVQGFVASLVFCSLWLCYGDVHAKDSDFCVCNHYNSDMHNYGGRKTISDHVALEGFDGYLVDTIIISYIPLELDKCVDNPVALGALAGLAYKMKGRSAYLSPRVVKHLHDLADAFTKSPKRKESLYKRLFCYIIEAMCSADCVNYARMRSLFAVTLKPDYVLKGLMRKENLHARVVASTLTLLEGCLRNAALGNVFEAKLSVIAAANGGGGAKQNEMYNSVTRERIVDVRGFMEGIWSAFHQAFNNIAVHKKGNIMLYVDNVRIVVESMLRVELAHVHYYKVISGAFQQEQNDDANVVLQRSQEHTEQNKQNNTSMASYVPLPEEEDIRFYVIQNISRFLLLPSSLFSIMLLNAVSSSHLQGIVELCVKVMTITASADGRGTSLWGYTSPLLVLKKASFSHSYYSSVDTIINELVCYLLKTKNMDYIQSLAFESTNKSNEGKEERVTLVRCRVAAMCLQGLSAASKYVHSFAVTELLDAAIHIPSFYYNGDLVIGGNSNPQNSKKTRDSDGDQHKKEEKNDKDNSIVSLVSNNTKYFSVFFEMICRVLVSLNCSILTPPPYDAIIGLGQTLVDIFEEVLQTNTINSVSVTKSCMESPDPVLVAIADSFWGLVQRFHRRIRLMAREGLHRMSSSSQEKTEGLFINAINAEGRIIFGLLSVLLRCMINIAWPGSGILYSKKFKNDGDNHGIFSNIKSTVISILLLFLGSISSLFQLSTLFPVLDLQFLVSHDENADRLTQGEGIDSFLPFYSFRPSNTQSQFYCENWIAQFRSFWLMLSYYRFSNEALAFVDTNATNTTLSKFNCQSQDVLMCEYAKYIRLIAVSAPPLIHMRSSAYQQAMEDINILKRHLSCNGNFCDTKAYHKELIKFLQVCLPEVASMAKRLSFSQIFLVNALATLEMLRASCGSLSTITHYQHFEVREFDAGSDIQIALRHVTTGVTTRYLYTLKKVSLDVAASKINETAQQLVLLYGFGIYSVRCSAKEILERIIATFPAIMACSTALPLLWEVINLLELGQTTDVELFCEQMHLIGTPAIATAPESPERHEQLRTAVALAEKWSAAARDCSPLSLISHATVFLLKEREGTSSGLDTSAAGSRLALSAHTMNVAASASSDENYAQIFTKRSIAQGQLREIFTLVPQLSVDILLLQRLSSMVVNGFDEAQMPTTLRGELLTSLANTVCTVKNMVQGISNNNNESSIDGDIDKRQEKKKEKNQNAVLREQLPLRCSKGGASQRLHDAERLLCTVAAFLTSERADSSFLQLELLRYIVHGPIRLFSKSYIGAAIQGWKWLLFERPERYAVPLLVQILEGFLWTVTAGIGLFDGVRPSESDQVELGDQGGSIPTEKMYSEDYYANSPHKLLIDFLLTCYVDVRGPVSFHSSVLLLLYHFAMRVLKTEFSFSTKAISFSEMMRCALMLYCICQNLQTANKNRLRAGLQVLISFDLIGKLRQGCYRFLLQWFCKTPSLCYFTQDSFAAESELVTLQKLIDILDENKKELEHSVEGFLDIKQLKSMNKLVVNDDGFSENSGLSVTYGSGCCGWGFGGNVKYPNFEKTNGSIFFVLSKEKDRVLNLTGLLRLLVEHERTRLMLWHKPLETENIVKIAERTNVTESEWRKYCEAAVQCDPALLIALVTRFSNPQLLRCATGLVSANPEVFSHLQEAVDLYLSDFVLRRGCPELYLFTNCTVVQSIRFLDGFYMKHYPPVSMYALRSLLAQKSENLIFYLPQILQIFYNDKSGLVAAFLCKMCKKSNIFAHQLLWSLQTKCEEEDEIAERCRQLAANVRAEFDAKQRKFYKGEFYFFQSIISLSGEMKHVEKSERREKLCLRLRDAMFHEPIGRHHLYLPTDTNWRVVRLIPHTARAMQSAAKCPILVQFECVPREQNDITVIVNNNSEHAQQQRADVTVKSCIFKMGDDCRQDQLALQLIVLFQRIFNAIQVPSFLFPYKVVSTGKDCGVIECVPDALSRDQIGKLVESNLAEYFVQTYGHPESKRFRQARDCFIRSMASYSVTSFILNVKDRHNGNIIIDPQGHIVHIDFGFLFDNSPGGDINFESSPFKLTAEMLQLMGSNVGRGTGTVQSRSLAESLVDEKAYKMYKELTIRCYLAVRQYARHICVLVELMLGSGLPCFKPQKTIQQLARRLSMELNEVEAADFMRQRISESKKNIRTFFYDMYQNIKEGIEM